MLDQLRKGVISLLFFLLPSLALGQTYPSPTYEDVTINGILTINACTGYAKATTGHFACLSAVPNTDVSGLGTASTQNTGTSGATVPLLNGANTWAAAQTFSAAPVTSTLTGYIKGNGASPQTASATVPSMDVATSGSAPGISSCGTGSPALATGATNTSGKFTTGSGASTACTITFANSGWPNYAFCVVTPAGAANSGLQISAQSKTAFTATYTSGTSLSFQYICFGN